MKVELVPIQLAIVAGVSSFYGTYAGALAIALIAATMRSVYGVDKTRSGFFNNLVLSTGMAMLMVHVSRIRGWDVDVSTILTGIAAFLSKELLDILVKELPSRILALIKKEPK
jgi:hypothetical protein